MQKIRIVAVPVSWYHKIWTETRKMTNFHLLREERTWMLLLQSKAVAFKVNTTPRELYEAINHKYALSYALDHITEE